MDAVAGERVEPTLKLIAQSSHVAVPETARINATRWDAIPIPWIVLCDEGGLEIEEIPYVIQMLWL